MDNFWISLGKVRVLSLFSQARVFLGDKSGEDWVKSVLPFRQTSSIIAKGNYLLFLLAAGNHGMINSELQDFDNKILMEDSSNEAYIST